jgi:hypothetical protein
MGKIISEPQAATAPPLKRRGGSEIENCKLKIGKLRQEYLWHRLSWGLFGLDVMSLNR